MKKLFLTLASTALLLTPLSAQDSTNEIKKVAKAPVSWYSKADKLKFYGLTYLGFTHTEFNDTAVDSTDVFEMRRSYVQVKAYLLDDPKSYYRVTLDMEHATSGANAGDYNVRFKYAYLYLNNILPFTGVELGIAHRPWIDYEEHNSWFYRDTHWVFVEAPNSAKLSNSADVGFNLKTKTEYFTSEVGVFTGEGYHNVEDGAGVSLEWRATAHLFGKHKKDAQAKETYFDASFYGQYNVQNAKYLDKPTGQQTDLIWAGLHTVLNYPSFMIAAQYVYSQNTLDTPDIYSKAGSGFNTHAVYRLGKDNEYRLIVRFDDWKAERNGAHKRTYYAGAAYEQNKNVQWVANILTYDDSQTAIDAKANSTAFMITTQVQF